MMELTFEHYKDGSVTCKAFDGDLRAVRDATRHEGATVEERSAIAAKRARASLYALMYASVTRDRKGLLIDEVV
jgi:hypothetical protein